MVWKPLGVKTARAASADRVWSPQKAVEKPLRPSALSSPIKFLGDEVRQRICHPSIHYTKTMAIAALCITFYITFVNNNNNNDEIKRMFLFLFSYENESSYLIVFNIWVKRRFYWFFNEDIFLYFLQTILYNIHSFWIKFFVKKMSKGFVQPL